MAVITAPLAIVIANGVPVGKLRDVTVNETISRARVVGLGQLMADELPPMAWTGTLSGSFYLTDLKRMFPSTNPNLYDPLRRDTGTDQAFADTLILQEQINGGFQIDMFRKVADVITNGIVTGTTLELISSIRGCYVSRDGFNVAEGQVGMRTVEFEYSRPILYPV